MLRKKGKEWHYTLGDRTWSGRTKAEVQAKAEADLDALLCWSNFTSFVLFSPEPGEAVLIRMTPEGNWGYEFIRPSLATESCPGDSQASGGTFGLASRREAVIRCRRNLAQLAYDKGLSNHEAWIYPGDKQGLSDHRTWVAWQDRYAEAKQDGKSDEDARALADKVGES